MFCAKSATWGQVSGELNLLADAGMPEVRVCHSGTKFPGFILESDTSMAKRPKKRRVVIKDLPVPTRDLNRQEMQQVKGGA